MADNFAEHLIRAEDAFTRNVIEGRSLRTVAKELGVSYETVRTDVAAWKAYLASERTAVLNERRATFEAELDANIDRAREVYKVAKAAGHALAAVGAVNAITAMMAHKRAVGGLDEPKESKVQEDITYNVRWLEEDEPVAPDRAARGFPDREF